MPKVIIAGSRNFNDYTLLETEVLLFISTLESPTILSGTARGADRLGEIFADKHNLQVERIPAEWDKHGRIAGYLRNIEMAKIATHCIVFWDGHSRGTKSMIDIAKKLKLQTKVVKYA